MNNAMLKEAANDQLVFAKETLTMITSGEIGVTKSIKPLVTATQQIKDAQVFISRIQDTTAPQFEHKIQIEDLFIKLEALINAAIALDEEDDMTLQLDVFNKISDIISKKLKPTILN